MSTTVNDEIPEDSPLAWMRNWSYWLRDNFSVERPPEPGTEAFDLLSSAARRLKPYQRTPPRSGTVVDWLPRDVHETLADECQTMITSNGYHVDGKWNAEVGPATESLLVTVDLPSVMKSISGLDVNQPHVATYIAYQEAGECLDFHVDAPEFGDVNVIICLAYKNAGTPTRSRTIFATPEGIVDFPTTEGMFMLFDGTFTPHGRTPVGALERVFLISLGFRLADRGHPQPAGLPPIPSARQMPGST